MKELLSAAKGEIITQSLTFDTLFSHTIHNMHWKMSHQTSVQDHSRDGLGDKCAIGFVTRRANRAWTLACSGVIESNLSSGTCLELGYHKWTHWKLKVFWLHPLFPLISLSATWTNQDAVRLQFLLVFSVSLSGNQFLKTPIKLLHYAFAGQNNYWSIHFFHKVTKTSQISAASKQSSQYRIWNHWQCNHLIPRAVKS